NFAYGVGSSNDAGGATLDRTREGYVEIIEMGYIIDNSTTYNQITHVNGVPPGCASVTDAQAAVDTSFLTGGLFGGMTLINVGAGTDYTEDAVALDNFYSLPQNLYSPAGATTPDLSLAAPPVATVFTTNSAGQPGVVQSTFAAGSISTVTGGIQAVSAVLMHNNVMNEYVLDPGT